MSLLTIEPVIGNLTPPQGVDTNPYVEGPFKADWNLMDPNVVQSGTQVGTDTTHFAYRFILYESTIIKHNNAMLNVCSVSKIYDTFTGDTDKLTFFKTYRTSIDNIHWSDWTTFDTLPANLNSLDDLYFEFKYVCVPLDPSQSNNLSNLYLDLSDVIVEGESTLERATLIATLTKPGQCVVVCPQDIWKVWKLQSFEVVAGGLTPNRTLDIKFRISTSSGKQWTPWLPLNNECLSSLKFDPLRFFMLEITLCRTGSDTTGVIKVYDIMFTGDFQNVTTDYQKFNRFGMRSDCRTSYNLDDCDPNAVQYPPAEWTDPTVCEDGSVKPFNPYDQGVIPIYNYLANQISNVFGWEVDYYKTDPDRGGTDRILHEYQLQNVVAVKKVKIIVEKNKFPENTLLANQFDLELFDTFQVHVTRDEFKGAFGIETRPAKWDFLFFCEWNRMYQVTHSIANKDFMNSSVYYILTLKKAQNNQHVRLNDPDVNFVVQNSDGSTETIEQSVKDLTENSSLDALFGQDYIEEVKKISEPALLRTLPQQQITREVNSYVRNIDYILQNGPNIISKNYWDLANVDVSQIAIEYENADATMSDCDDRTFMVWFNLKTLRQGRQYNILTNQAIINGAPNGYRFNYQDNRFDLEWGGQFLEVMVPQIENNIWYCMVLRMHQTANKWQFRLYRRQSDVNPRSYTTTELKLVIQDQGDLMPISFNIGSTPIVIYGSEMLMTNIRIFDNVIAEQSLTELVNQYIVRENQHLVLVDNAQPKFNLPNIRYRTIENDPYT